MSRFLGSCIVGTSSEAEATDRCCGDVVSGVLYVRCGAERAGQDSRRRPELPDSFHDSGALHSRPVVGARRQPCPDLLVTDIDSSVPMDLLEKRSCVLWTARRKRKGPRAKVLEDPGCEASPTWSAFRQTLMQLTWDDNAVFAHQQYPRFCETRRGPQPRFFQHAFSVV